MACIFFLSLPNEKKKNVSRTPPANLDAHPLLEIVLIHDEQPLLALVFRGLRIDQLFLRQSARLHDRDCIYDIYYLIIIITKLYVSYSNCNARVV